MSKKIFVVGLFSVLAALCLFAVTVQVPTHGVLFPMIASFSSQMGAFSCASGNYNSCRFVDYSGGAHNFIGPATGYEIWTGSRKCDPVDSTIINGVSGTSFTIPVSVTFSKIWFSGCVADTTPNTGAAIINIAGPNLGLPICHNTTPVAVAVGPIAVPCSEGTVTLTPGAYALVWTTSTTTGKWYMSGMGNSAPVLMGTQSIGNCTGRNGVINFAIPCDNIAVGVVVDNSAFPNMMLY